MTIIELRNKRAQKLAAAKAFLESNRNQDGFLSEEDDATYTKLETEITNLGNEISRMERLESLDSELSKPVSTPITEKPAETRMGSGKGSPEYWVAVVKPGRVMFEMDGVAVDVAREAMRLASHKLPIKCKFVTKEDV